MTSSHAVVVSPDLGNAKNVARSPSASARPVAAGAKERISDTEVKITAIIGDVEGRDVIVLDDEIANGGSMIELMRHLRQHGARTIRIACTTASSPRTRCSASPPSPDLIELGLHRHATDRLGRQPGQAHRTVEWRRRWPRPCAASIQAESVSALFHEAPREDKIPAVGRGPPRFT